MPRYHNAISFPRSPLIKGGSITGSTGQSLSLPHAWQEQIQEAQSSPFNLS